MTPTTSPPSSTTASPPPWNPAAPTADQPNLIVGLIPHAHGPMDTDMATALHQRQQLIERCAREVLSTALADRAPWTQTIGPPPTDPHHRQQWLGNMTTIAAYRDLHQITGPQPLGSEATPHIHPAHKANAQRAIQLAQQFTQPPDNSRGRHSHPSGSRPVPRLE